MDRGAANIFKNVKALLWSAVRLERIEHFMSMSPEEVLGGAASSGVALICIGPDWLETQAGLLPNFILILLLQFILLLMVPHLLHQLLLFLL